MEVPLGLLARLSGPAKAPGDPSRLHARAEDGARDRDEGREVDEIEERGVLVGEVSREGSTEGGAAVLEVLIALEDLVEGAAKSNQIGLGDQSFANEVAIPNVARDLVGRREHLHLAHREAAHGVEDPVAQVVTAREARFVERECHRLASCLAEHGPTTAFCESNFLFCDS